MDWFDFLVTKLNKRGDVYLVRISVSEPMHEIEKKNWVDFDDIIFKYSEKHDCKYFNFVDEYDSYETTDGNHLYKESAIKFTKQLSDSILMLNKPFN